MAKRTKGSKLQKPAELRRGKRGKTRKVAKSAKATKRTAKPKRAPVKKAARKERIKPPVAPAIETAAAEHPAPEFEEVNKVSPGPDEPAE
jgi:hypothetical protein